MNEELDVLVIAKEKKGKPTVIYYGGERYVLDHRDSYRGPKAKRGKKGGGEHADAIRVPDDATRAKD